MYRKYPKYLHHDHSPESIQLRLSQQPQKASVRDFVYGAIDGTVTTFAIVAGVKGAELSTATILILGMSNILADGFSMAAGNYLGTKADLDEQALVHDFEKNQILVNPHGEAEEVRQIYMAKGFEGELLEQTVKTVIQDREQWLKIMMAEEYGYTPDFRSPLKAGGITFLAFLLFGFIPLIPYLIGVNNAFTVATVLTGTSFFMLGALKSMWSLEPAWSSGLKTFVIGSMAASFAYGVGILLKDIVP